MPEVEVVGEGGGEEEEEDKEDMPVVHTDEVIVQNKRSQPLLHLIRAYQPGIALL
jgi:hypothetical protein